MRTSTSSSVYYYTLPLTLLVAVLGEVETFTFLEKRRKYSCLRMMNCRMEIHFAEKKKSAPK